MKWNWNKSTYLGFAMPLTWPYINSMTHISCLAMHRPNFLYLDSSRGGDIAEKRELQVNAGMDNGCTEIFLLDGDMVYPPESLNDMYGLLKNGADMAGVVCYRGYPPYNPLIWHPTEERQLRPFEDYQFGDIVEAGSTGAACLLIKREVFEKLPRPWFRIQQEETKEWDVAKDKLGRLRRKGKSITTVLRRGEDTYFTRNATKAGFKLKILTSYDLGHLSKRQG